MYIQSEAQRRLSGGHVPPFVGQDGTQSLPRNISLQFLRNLGELKIEVSPIALLGRGIELGRRAGDPPSRA